MGLAILMFHSCDTSEELRVYMIGDSTMAPKSKEQTPKTGWGERFSEFFTDNVLIINHAKNGRSTKSFIDEGRWQIVFDSLREGDYLFIQFGHNDEKENRPELYASPEVYAENLIKFIQGSREKGAVPILLTPIVRRRFDQHQTFFDTNGKYNAMARKVAGESGVDFIDMNSKTLELVITIGPEMSKDIFLWLEPGESANYPYGVEDDTHLSPFGAKKVAALAAEGLVETGCYLGKYLK